MKSTQTAAHMGACLHTWYNACMTKLSSSVPRTLVMAISSALRLFTRRRLDGFRAGSLASHKPHDDGQPLGRDSSLADDHPVR